MRWKGLSSRPRSHGEIQVYQAVGVAAQAMIAYGEYPGIVSTSNAISFSSPSDETCSKEPSG
jgi:hypothetical protein